MNSVYLSKLQSNINTLNQNVEKTTNQVASGKRFQEGSEDVEAFNIHLQIKQDLNVFSMVSNDLLYGKNILSNTENAMTTMEDLLSTMNTNLVKLANTASYSDQDQAIMLNQFETFRTELVNLANTQVNGQFIFSGSFTERAPFDQNKTEINPETLVEEMVYMGDDQKKEVYVDKNAKKEFSVTGQEMFVDSKIFEKVDEIINLLKNRELETSKELNNLEKTENKLFGGKMIDDINNSLQELDYTQLTVTQKTQVNEYSNSIQEYIRVPSMENYKTALSQKNALLTNPGTGATGPWDYPTELNAMLDLAEYNVSLNTYNNGQELLSVNNINQAWNTNTDINGASTFTFELTNEQDLNNIKIDLNLFDPDGNVHIAFNGTEIQEIPNHSGTSAITLADLKGEVFSKGINTLQIWSDTNDSGTLNDFKVYTDSNADLFEQKDYILNTYGSFLSTNQLEDITYQYDLTMYKVDLKNYVVDPSTENLDKMTRSRDMMNNEISTDDIYQWKIDQSEKYTSIIGDYTNTLNNYVTQINGSTDISAITDYQDSIEAFFKDPSQANYDVAKTLRDNLLTSVFTSTVITPTDEISNMFDYVDYLHNSNGWSDTQVTPQVKEINDYMYNLAKNPFSTKIEDLQDVSTKVSTSRAKLGNTYAYFETMELKINNKTLELQKFYSDNVDADMAQVATKLTQETNALNALYSVVAKLQSLSLTNYLK